MRTRVSRKGKKIVAMVLAFAMVLPLTWSQTIVARAEDVTTTPAESNVVYLAIHTSDTKATDTEIEPGKEIQIDIKAKQKLAITSTTMIDGKLTFSSKGYSPDQLLDYLPVTDVVDPDGKEYGFGAKVSGVGYGITIHGLYSQETTFDQDATIATITLDVQRSIDEVNVTLNQMNITARTVDASGKTTDVTEKNAYTSLDLANTLKGQHKVVFEMPQGLVGKVANSYTTELIEVPIKIAENGNTGFCGVQISFKYDEKRLRFVDYKLSPEAAKYLKVQTANASLNLLSGVIQLAFAAETDTHFTGDFLTLRFATIANESEVSNGKTVTSDITPTIKELNNISGMSIEKGDMKGEFTSGKEKSTITLEQGWQLGDVNKDGRVNLVDVAWVLQSYNGIRVLNSEQTTLGDVNGDKKVTLVDAILILKYVNGEISSFGTKK